MYLFLMAAVALSAAAAWTDWRTGRIPNWLTLGGALVAIVGHTVYGWAVEDWQTGLYQGAFSVAGLLFCSIAPAILFWKGGMGGGDVKLCHPLLGIETQMYALVVAAVAAPARLAYHGRLFQVLGASLALLFNPFLPPNRRRAAPAEAMTWFRLGPAILVGALVTLLVHGYAS